MKDLVEAAVAAAGRSGVRMTMLIMGGADAPTTAPAVQVGTSTDKEREELVTRLADARRDLAALSTQLAEAQKAGSSTAAGTAKALQDQLAASNEEVAKLKAIIATNAQQPAPAAQAPAPGAPQNGEAVGSLDALPVDGLGLDEKILSAVKKHGIVTIGALRTAYLQEGGLYGSVKGLTKDHMHAVGMALLRNTPSSGGAPAPAAAAAPSAPSNGHAPVTVNADATLPEGHADRLWRDRFNAARSKEDRFKATDASIKALYEKVKAEHPGTVKDGSVDFEALRVAARALHDQIRKEESDLAIVRAQMIAMLWGCGLPIDCPSIQAAVEKANVKLPAPPAPATVAAG